MASLTATRGDTFERTFIWKDYNGDVIDLTDYTVSLIITINGVAEIYTDGDGLTVTAGAGQIDISIEEDITADWKAHGRFALVATSGDSNPVVTTINRGRLRVE